MYINPSLNPTSCDSTAENVISALIVLNGTQHLLSLVYRPPNANPLENQSIIDSLMEVRSRHPNCTWSVLGDFNLPDANYEFPYNRCHDLSYDIFFEFFSENLLTQLVKGPTRDRATLDLLWCSSNTAFDKVLITSPLANSDHNTIIATFAQKVKSSEDNYVYYRQLDINYATQVLQKVNWSNILAANNNVNDMVSTFMAIVDHAVPYVRRRIKINNSKRMKLPKHIRNLI
jgi:hypothetical protein